MIKIKLVTNVAAFESELMELIRAYSQYVEIDESGVIVEIIVNEIDNKITVIASCGILNYKYQFVASHRILEDKKLTKRYLIIALYRILEALTGINLPWGSLTGVHPTKLAYEFVDNLNTLKDTFLISPSKISLLKKIIDTQRGYREISDNNVDIYVNIPFCVSRCSYCSFISAVIGDKKKLIPNYIAALKSEIIASIEIIKKKCLNLRSIYVGGGTPTALKADELYEVLEPLKSLGCSEFTIEAGRPDTITIEKLEAINSLNATRISINPQTFNDTTLQEIGRKHNILDIYNAYELARKFTFEINMDLIAALPNENYLDFVNSINKTIELAPENITVHALSIKKSSRMCDIGYSNKSNIAEQMVNYSSERLINMGYNPYYLYRQKYTSGNLENTGYTRTKPCIYNIDNMEECASILANGAGAISKRIFHNDNRIERLSNVKNIEEYLKRIDIAIKNKYEFYI